MNPDVVEMTSIEHKSIAKLLKILNEEGKSADGLCSLNKIMNNISWKLGHEPNMVLGGKILPPDVVAISILDLPLVNRGFAYYVVEITDGSAVEDSSSYQYLGACICQDGGFVMQKISCYTFIDWLNEQDLSFVDKVVKKMSIYCTADSIIYIRCVV